MVKNKAKYRFDDLVSRAVGDAQMFALGTFVAGIYDYITTDLSEIAHLSNPADDLAFGMGFMGGANAAVDHNKEAALSLLGLGVFIAHDTLSSSSGNPSSLGSAATKVISYGLGALIGAGIISPSRTRKDSMMAIQATYEEEDNAEQARKFLDSLRIESTYLDTGRSEVNVHPNYVPGFSKVDAKLIGNGILMNRNKNPIDDYLASELRATEYSNSGVIQISESLSK